MALDNTTYGGVGAGCPAEVGLAILKSGSLPGELLITFRGTHCLTGADDQFG